MSAIANILDESTRVRLMADRGKSEYVKSEVARKVHAWLENSAVEGVLVAGVEGTREDV
jgi:hypothetical protein